MTAATASIETVDMNEIEAILEQAKAALSEEQHRKLKAALETLAFLTSEIEDKRTSIKRLRKLLFGATSEKTKKVLEGLLDDTPQETDGGAEPGAASSAGEDSAEPEKKPKPKGHGRNGAEAYRGATRMKVRHESLKPGDPCKEKGCKGRVSRLKKPARLLRIRGGAPLQAELVEKERLRCNLCGKIFTAKSPEGIGEEKYDATAASMMAILRYGAGLPLNRLAQLQDNLGIPLPASTQWDVANGAAPIFSPVYEELIRRAAQGKVLHNDDTSMTILEYLKEDRERRNRGDPPDRTGIFTSGVVSVDDEIQIALFFTGRQHAGENLAKVLAERDKELDLAIQMCDALSRNVSAEFASIVCNCMSHARRQYVDVFEDFPQECEWVLKTLGKVFKNDATARKQGMTAEERLVFHRKTSKRVMAELRQWMSKQFKERLVEPNSGLGQAITYMRKHWRKLTRFLFIAGAPLENNLCERMLKKAICHRRNSLFYKTANGARVGDIYMSLIATCQLIGVNPFDYLTELQRHASEVKASPASWLPWNYERAVGRGVEKKDATTSEKTS
jgi:transposase